ncbi:hypothetical protein [Nocardia sp. NPDC004123]
MDELVAANGFTQNRLRNLAAEVRRARSRRFKRSTCTISQAGFPT